MNRGSPYVIYIYIFIYVGRCYATQDFVAGNKKETEPVDERIMYEREQAMKNQGGRNDLSRPSRGLHGSLQSH